MPRPTSPSKAARSPRSPATSPIASRSSARSSRIVHDRGGIDVLVNNAGIIQVGPLEHMTVDDFEEAMATHFWGPLFTILAALPHMRGSRARRIVNISSIGGKIAVPHLLPYTRQQVRADRTVRRAASGAGRAGLRGHDGVPGPDAHRVDLQRDVQGPAPARVRVVPSVERDPRRLDVGGAGRPAHRRRVPARRPGADPHAERKARRARQRHQPEHDGAAADARQSPAAGAESRQRRSARIPAGRASRNTCRRRSRVWPTARPSRTTSSPTPARPSCGRTSGEVPRGPHA